MGKAEFQKLRQLLGDPLEDGFKEPTLSCLQH